MHQLSEESKRTIEKNVGIPFDDIVKMDSIQEKVYVEKKIGKKLVWPDVVCVRTIEEIDEKISEIINSSY